MKTLKTLQVFAKIGKILCKIIYICSLIGGIGCAVGMSFAWIPSAIKIGSMTVTGFVADRTDFSLGTGYAAMFTGLALCTGEAFLSKIAEGFFALELEVGTPFDLRVSKKLLDLGIKTIWIPVVAAIVAAIGSAVLKGILGGSDAFESGKFIQIWLGVTFIIVSLILKAGAEQIAGTEAAADTQPTAENN